jgi:hypothetical protein
VGCLAAVAARAAPAQDSLAPPSNVEAKDDRLRLWDKGDTLDVTWELSPDDPHAGGLVADFAGYKVYRTMTPAEIVAADGDAEAKAVAIAKNDATERLLEEADLSLETFHQADDALLDRIRAARAAAAETATFEPSDGWLFIDATLAGGHELEIDKLARGEPYGFKVEAFTMGSRAPSAASTAGPVAPTLEWFTGKRLALALIVLILCGAIVYWIWHARSGRPIKVRKIAGLEAVDEAVGRATEMGRSCLFIPGIQDMNDIQTIAGLTVLARVAKTAAEYDARIEVPTSRSLVMATARETVHASFLEAGRPDAYNADLIYYVTDEQFGYVAYLSGMMVREKPAACFYMGSFFAESLILAETGNSIGAIQIAGTAQPAQLPFFVAACDYTLIGEEFFAASAYLSGSPEELGSLKGQDVGKLIVWIFMAVGITIATIATLTGSAKWMGVVEFIKTKMLT